MTRLMTGLLALMSACQADAIRFDFSPDHVVPPNLAGKPAPLTFTVARAAVPPEIDGTGHDAVWERAPVLPELGIPTPPTRVRLLYDDQAVYLLVECQDEAGWPSVAAERASSTARARRPGTG